MNTTSFRPRGTAAEAERIAKVVIQRLRGYETSKAIAFDIGYSDSRVRRIAWDRGWRSIFLSPIEQQTIKQLRSNP